MYPPIFPVCSYSADLTALLGSPPQMRLYQFGLSPQLVSYPYAVWQIVSGGPENFLAHRPDADAYTVQVDVYADTASSARNVAEAIRDAIELQSYIVGWRGESIDPETKKYRLGFDVDWIVQR